MARKILGVSWVNGRFHAAATVGDSITSWAAPNPVRDTSEFEIALAEAVRQTSFSGAQVSLVLDHRSLHFHVQETPPAEGKTVDLLLERLVSRSQFFEESAAWGRLSLPSSKGRHRHLLALLPESLVQGLVACCLRLRLSLVAVFPLAAVLGDQLRLLSAQESETILLAADLRGGLHLLLGRPDGQVLFSRTVSVDGQNPGERAAQEINRTLHYAQQQFGESVTKLFIYGGKALEILEKQTLRPGLSIAPSPVAEDSFYFARNVVPLSAKLRLNLLSPPRRNPNRRRQIAALAIASLIVITITTIVFTSLTVRAQERAWQNQVQRNFAEAQIRDQSAALRTRSEYLETLLSVIRETNPPVALAVTAMVVNQVTGRVHLTRLDLNWATNNWRLHLEGAISEEKANFLDILEELEQCLQSPPLQVRITASTARVIMGGPPSGRAVSVKHSARKQDKKEFFIDGVIE